MSVFAVWGQALLRLLRDDAGGIATYAAAETPTGMIYYLLLLISTVCLAVAQEISARTGAVTDGDCRI